MCFVEKGKPWQFKEFPFKGADKGDTVETFSNIFGAFFHYKDEKVSCWRNWRDGGRHRSGCTRGGIVSCLHQLSWSVQS